LLRRVGLVAAFVALCGLGCATTARGRLMTWTEYRQVRHVAPYVLDIARGSGRLVYVGSRHTNDATALDIALIESLWSQARPELAFNEGGDPPTESTKAEAVRLYGESGFVRFLAARDGVPVASLEPTKQELAKRLVPEFGAELVKLGFLLLQVKHHRNNPTEPFETAVARTFSTLNRTPGLEGQPRDLAELERRFAARFPEAPVLRQLPEAWTDPVQAINEMNAFYRRASEERDRHMIDLLADRVRQGQRVFAVVGASHVVMQEAAVRAALR